ncbi:MAG: hypothetical protein C4539_10440 [Ignavibacteriales bacterium]|nr:MAG: hypothetical protein C4539_10440 [Ignavibacteriales bacterium]
MTLLNGNAILAKIRDKVITANEFIKRAEYTIRPQYCKGNSGTEKKIILNSLVAEKLIAIEAEDSYPLLKEKFFVDFIQGKQEQLMRQMLFDEEGLSKVNLDSNEVRKMFSLSGRKYNINYFLIPNDTTFSYVTNSIGKGTSFDRIYKALTNSDSLPSREVEYFIAENETIHKAMYSDSLYKDQVIGPIKISDSSAIVIKVNGWTEKIPITDNDIRTRAEDVKEKLSYEHAASIYTSFVLNIMKGKKLEFYKSTFPALVQLASKEYYFSIKEKENSFLDLSFNNSAGEIKSLGVEENIKFLYDKAVFTFDGKIWTVKDLENELKIHPLVFRNKRFSKDQFASEFKLAIADLIRDKMLTGVAYNKKYNENELIKRNTEMWKDATVALYNKYEYLKSFNTTNVSWLEVIEKFLNPFIDSLQIKYSKDIEINTVLLNKIKLTSTDLMVIQYNVPYPVYVPAFPFLTTDNKLDYGRKMDKETMTVSE